MKKTNAIFLYLLLSSCWCAAQITAPNDIVILTSDVPDTTLVPRRMISTQDGGFLHTGSNGQRGYISRTNNCGRLLWMRQYLLGSASALNSVAELPSGEIVAAGTCLNCVPGDSVQKALIIKTDASGLLLADTMLGYTGFRAAASDIIATAAGKVAVTGYVDFAGFLGPSDAFLFVSDNQIHLETWKQLNHFYRDAGNALTQTADGGFAIAGESVPAFFAPRQAQLFRADASGNLAWKYTSAYPSSQFNSVRQASDGRIVTLGDRLVDTLVGQDVFLTVHNDGNGSLQLEKTYGSPGSDAGKSLERIQDGYLVGAVYGKPSQTGWSVRSWVFRLDEQFNLTDQYFRDGYLFAHLLTNALPLSGNGSSFAFEANLQFFISHAGLFFKRTFQGDRAVLTQAPQNYQLVPRNLTTNKGMVTYSGSVNTAGAYDEIRLDVLRNDVLQTTLYDNTPQNFDFSHEINAELAEYTFRLYGLKDQLRYPEAEACDVVAGDAYFIQGQSNAVAGAPYDPLDTIDHAYRHHRTRFVRNFGLKFANDTLLTWRTESGDGDYADNPSGQWGLVFGKEIVDTYGIPVAIINGAISGIPIDYMMPDPLDHANPATSYGLFLRRVERSGLNGRFRAKLMFQGESNAAGGFWDSADSYYQKFATLDAAWNQDFPGIGNAYLFQIRPGAYWAGATLLTCLQVEEAQRRIAETLPPWQIMSSTGMNHDGTHYYYPNGYERAGHDIFRLLAHDLYGETSTANIHPPTVDSLQFTDCNRREIILYLRHENDSYSWTPGWENDFLLEGSGGDSVTGGQIIGNRVVLSLSGAPGVGFTGLSYTSHIVGGNAPVKNTNGIGMLTFYNLAVSPAPTPETGETLLLCAGSTIILPDGTIVSHAGVYVAILNTGIGCDSIVTITVESDSIFLSDTVVVSDNGTGNGSLTVQAGGGFAPYTYTWNTGATLPGIDNLPFGPYTVTVSDVNLCVQTFELLVPMSIGTSAASGSLQVQAFPNPCGEFLDVRIAGMPGKESYMIRISDLLGSAVVAPFVTRGENTRIETGGLPAGTYMLRILENGVLRWSGLFVKK